MSVCPPKSATVGAKASVLNGAVFARKHSDLYAMELDSIADNALDASTPVQSAHKLTDANAELTRMVEQCRRIGGATAEPVVVGIGWRIRQTITMPAVAGGTVANFMAPFTERYALCTINVSIGSAGNAYLKGKTYPLATMHDLARVEIAPRAFRNAFALTFDSRAARFSSVPGILTLPESDAAFIAEEPDRRAYLDTDQLRTVYSTAGTTEPRNGTPDGDFTFFPLTFDGLLGDIGGAGVRLSKLRDLANGQVNWTLTFENNHIINDGATQACLYRSGVHAQDPAFGTIQVIPILYYRIGDFSAQGAEKGANLEGEIWTYQDNLPKLSPGTGTLDLAASQIAGLTMLGWRKRYHDANTDADSFFFQKVDPGPALPYRPCIRMIPPAISVVTNLQTKGNYLSVGTPEVEEYPCDTNAIGVTLLREFNAPWRRQACNGSVLDGVVMGQELPLFQNATDRTATTSLVSMYPVVYGTVAQLNAGTAGAVTTITLNSLGGSVAGLGGFQRLPIAWSNPSIMGAPSLGAREIVIDGNGVVTMDPRTLHLALTGGWLPPYMTVAAAPQGFPVSNLYRSGPYASGCDAGKAGGAVPVTISGASPSSQILSASISTSYMKGG